MNPPTGSKGTEIYRRGTRIDSTDTASDRLRGFADRAYLMGLESNVQDTYKAWPTNSNAGDAPIEVTLRTGRAIYPFCLPVDLRRGFLLQSNNGSSGTVWLLVRRDGAPAR